MIVAESIYSFAIPSLADLFQAVGTADFNPNPAQQLVLQRAIQLLDLELRYQAIEQPDLVETIHHLLADQPD